MVSKWDEMTGTTENQGISNPLYGENSIISAGQSGDTGKQKAGRALLQAGKWASMMGAVDDINKMNQPTEIEWNAYNPNQGSFDRYGQDYESMALQRSSQNAPQSDFARIDPMMRTSGSTIAQSQGYDPAQMQAARMQMQQQAMNQQGQNRSLALLEAAARGQAPSAAQQQLMQGASRSQRAAMSMAASQPGMSAGQAARMATMSGERSMMDANEQAGILRAQEMAQARGQFMQGTGAARGQDIGIMSQQAKMQQQAAMQNAAMQQQSSQFGADAANQRAIQQAQLSQQAGMFNVDAHNKATMQQAQLEQQTNLANQQAEQQKLQLMQQYMQMGMSQQEADRQAQIEAERIRATQNQTDAQVAIAQAQGDDKSKGGAIGMIGGLFSSFSDERVKKNIDKEKTHEEAYEMLDQLKAASFDYKEGYGKGKRYGIMAQDMEKSRLGSTVVGKTKKGVRYLDGQKTVGALLASVATMHQRLKKVEGK